MTALTIVIIAAIGWISFGIFKFALNTSRIGDLALGAFIGAVLLLNAIIALRSRALGGWLLVFEGLLPIAAAIASGNLAYLQLSLIAGPPIISGLFFVID